MCLYSSLNTQYTQYFVWKWKRKRKSKTALITHPQVYESFLKTGVPFFFLAKCTQCQGNSCPLMCHFCLIWSQIVSYSENDFVKHWKNFLIVLLQHSATRIDYQLASHNYYSLIQNSGLWSNNSGIYQRMSRGPNVLTALTGLHPQPAFNQSINPSNLEQPVYNSEILNFCQLSPCWTELLGQKCGRYHRAFVDRFHLIHLIGNP